MTLSCDELTALRCFADGPHPVSVLFSVFSRTRSYELAKRLGVKGALRQRGTLRELLPVGRAVLEGRPSAEARVPLAAGLEQAVPHLQHAPTAPHRP